MASASNFVNFVGTRFLQIQQDFARVGDDIKRIYNTIRITAPKIEAAFQFAHNRIDGLENSIRVLNEKRESQNFENVWSESQANVAQQSNLAPLQTRIDRLEKSVSALGVALIVSISAAAYFGFSRFH